MVAPITHFGVFLRALRDTLAGRAVTYEEYRNAVLIVVVEAETYRRPALNLAGQIDVWQALRQAGLEVKENKGLIIVGTVLVQEQNLGQLLTRWRGGPLAPAPARTGSALRPSNAAKASTVREDIHEKT